MDTPSLLINLTALGASILALIFSSRIGRRQTKYMRDASHVDVALEYFREFRTPEFLASMDYVRTQLANEHEPETGCCICRARRETMRSRSATSFRVSVFLLKFRITDADMWITCMGRQITTAWEAISPYAKVERKRGTLGVASLHFFEDLGSNAPASRTRSSSVAGSSSHIRSKCPSLGSHAMKLSELLRIRQDPPEDDAIRAVSVSIAEVGMSS